MSNRPLILIVDDHPDLLEALAEMVNAAGYECLTAGGGKQALKTVAKRTPDAIILDRMMPEMDGLEVLQALKRDPETAQIPVIVTSAVTDSPSIAKAREAGATEYWDKVGLNPDGVARRLDEILRRRKSAAFDA